MLTAIFNLSKCEVIAQELSLAGGESFCAWLLAHQQCQLLHRLKDRFLITCLIQRMSCSLCLCVHNLCVRIQRFFYCNLLQSSESWSCSPKCRARGHQTPTRHHLLQIIEIDTTRPLHTIPLLILLYSVALCCIGFASVKVTRCSLSGFDLSFLDPKAPPDVATVPKDAEILPSSTAKKSRKRKTGNSSIIYYYIYIYIYYTYIHMNHIGIVQIRRSIILDIRRCFLSPKCCPVNSHG